MFNGTMAAWRPFIFQFKEVARVGKWSKRTRLERLMGCLTDKAVTFVEKVRRDKRRDYKVLLTTLEKRYGTIEPPSTIRTRIQGTRQDEVESLEEWADRIYALSLDGYPGAPEDMVDSLAVEHFYSGMQDKKAALAVSQGRKKAYNISKALKYTNEYLHQQVLLLGKSYSARKVSFSEPSTVSSPVTNWDDLTKAMQEMGTKLAADLEVRLLEKLKPSLSVRSRSPTNDECFRCSEKGHFARNCPKMEQSKSRSRSPSPMRGLCFNCRQPGHLFRDCPHPKPGSPKANGLGSQA